MFPRGRVLEISEAFIYLFFAAVLKTEGFVHLKENVPLLQSELLKTIAGFYDGHAIGDEGSQSVLAQTSVGEDRINRRRVRQKVVR